MSRELYISRNNVDHQMAAYVAEQCGQLGGQLDTAALFARQVLTGQLNESVQLTSGTAPGEHAQPYAVPASAEVAGYAATQTETGYDGTYAAAYEAAPATYQDSYGAAEHYDPALVDEKRSLVEASFPAPGPERMN